MIDVITTVARVTYAEGFSKGAQPNATVTAPDKSRTIGHYVVGKPLLLVTLFR